MAAARDRLADLFALLVGDDVGHLGGQARKEEALGPFRSPGPPYKGYPFQESSCYPVSQSCPWLQPRGGRGAGDVTPETEDQKRCALE
jgi:hypothetical protein